MAPSLRLLQSVVAVAAGQYVALPVAPVVIPPSASAPVTLPTSGVATQTLGNLAGPAAAPMPSMSVTALAPGVGVQPGRATVSGLSNDELVQVLTDSQAYSQMS